MNRVIWEEYETLDHARDVGDHRGVIHRGYLAHVCTYAELRRMASASASEPAASVEIAGTSVPLGDSVQLPWAKSWDRSSFRVENNSHETAERRSVVPFVQTFVQTNLEWEGLTMPAAA